MNGGIDIWVAALATLLGGIGLKVTEFLLGKKGREEKAFSDTKHELEDEVRALEKRIDDIEKEVDYWKDRYYTLRQQQLDKFVELIVAGGASKEDLIKFMENHRNEKG